MTVQLKKEFKEGLNSLGFITDTKSKGLIFVKEKNSNNFNEYLILEKADC